MTGTRGRKRAERGATMLEFALVLPFLLLMAFGTAEMGLAWVANNRVEGSSSTAARIAASSGSLAEADRNILVSLRSSLPPGELANLDRVIVFKPTDSDGTVPSACIKAVGDGSQVGVSAQCNTYAGNTVRTVTDTTDLGSADDFWAPSTRKDTLAGPPDRIGIWVRTTHDAQTGTFWSDFAITKSSIYRIQPDIDG